MSIGSFRCNECNGYVQWTPMDVHWTMNMLKMAKMSKHVMGSIESNVQQSHLLRPSYYVSIKQSRPTLIGTLRWEPYSGLIIRTWIQLLLLNKDITLDISSCIVLIKLVKYIIGQSIIFSHLLITS